MYETGMFRTMRLNHPVVSVGTLRWEGPARLHWSLPLRSDFEKKGFVRSFCREATSEPAKEF